MKETVEIYTNQEDKIQMLNSKLDIVLEELSFQRYRREQVDDLIKDLSPVIRQMGLDLIDTLHKLEQKGYFIFFRELLNILDKIVAHFTVDDLKALANNIVTILETIKNLTQPDMLKAINNGLAVYKNLETENVKEVSMLKAFRIMNSKEGKRALGFIMTFLINVAKNTEQNKTNINQKNKNYDNKNN